MPQRTCSIEGCGEAILNIRGWCNKHYLRFQRHGDPLGSAPPREMALCETPDCDRKHYSRGMCRKHYDRVKRAEWTASPTRFCDIDGCAKAHNARGMCTSHYKQWQAEQRSCVVDDCPRGYARGGYCRGHYDRLRKYGDPLAGPPIRERAPNGQARPVRNGYGYVLVYAPEHSNAQRSGYLLEHIKVMADLLGRPLRKGENVHHLNGVRDDNRPQNLELWTTMQPSGKRPRDLVQYALEVIALYGDDPSAPNL